jgi:hypothetical protein
LALRLLASLFILSWPWAIGLRLPLALLLFPDGRAPGKRWRWLIWAITLPGLRHFHATPLRLAGDAGATRRS